MAQNSLRLVEDKSVDKSKPLEAALSQIERSFGKGSIMKLGSNENVVEVETVSTGSLSLDIALGIGGLPKGRIIEIYGPESSGKTTLALQTIAEAQKRAASAPSSMPNMRSIRSMPASLALICRVFLISQPDTGEQALRSPIRWCAPARLTCSWSTRCGADAAGGNRRRDGRQPAGSSGASDEPGAAQADRFDLQVECMVIFINQIRMKIGVMFGSPETTTGGNALKFYASVRLDIRRIGAVKEREEVVGNQTRVKVVKNKMAPPFKQVEFDIMYGEGVSKTGELVDLGVKAVSSKSLVHGSLITASVSGRGVKMPRPSCATIRIRPMRSNWRCARMPV